MTFKDYFSKHSKDYARFRPHYPDDLFQYLNTLVNNHLSAWDCGTGNGQVALSLVKYFQKVYASDASASQIANTIKHNQIEYFVSVAESTSLASQSIDLITVAQAFHWFDATRFYEEVKRVLKPDGILAIWCYGYLEIPTAEEKLTTALDNLYQIVEPFWPPERNLVNTGYKTIPFPFAEIITPNFSMSMQWSAEELIGYLSTWSSTQRCLAEKGEEIILKAMEAIANSYPVNQSLEIHYPITLRVGKLNSLT